MNQLAAQILSSNRYCTLSTVNSDGTPHGSPLFYVNDAEFIYWWSQIDSQHSQNILHSNKVYITIFDSQASEEEAKGLYIQSTAGEVPIHKSEEVLKLYNAKAESFNLSKEDVINDSPSRLYQAAINKIWTNSSGDQNGHYIDVREELK